MKSDKFRFMPPLGHDRVFIKSEVLAHIAEVTGQSIEQTARTFHYLRNKGHLVFNSRTRKWSGAEYIPTENDEQFRARMASELAELRKICKENLAKCRSLQSANDIILENFNALVSHVNQKKG